MNRLQQYAEATDRLDNAERVALETAVESFAAGEDDVAAVSLEALLGMIQEQ